MVAAELPIETSFDPIRKFDLSRDLDPVADLIEMCFPIHADPDGRTYVKEMRKTARELRLMGRLVGLSDNYPLKSAGFVWEENGKVIGNISLIPLMRGGRRVQLIANVAVHPHHRRRGIAKKLTQRAFNALRQQNETEVWLQVRDDNPAAIQLYRSFGFIDQAIRTTWRILPVDRNEQTNSPSRNCQVGRWFKRNWKAQQTWLEAAYPANIRWQLPVKFDQFSTDILQQMANFLEGNYLKHWTVKSNGEFQGVITWQKTNTYADNLWLAFPVEKEAELLPSSLAQVLKHVNQKRPLSVDYPKGRCTEQFIHLGFEEFRSLIWMAYWL
jgi:ribosomal protein S18 acetylase RimI-like enzyme